MHRDSPRWWDLALSRVVPGIFDVTCAVPATKLALFQVLGTRQEAWLRDLID